MRNRGIYEVQELSRAKRREIQGYKKEKFETWMQALINGKEGIDVEGIKQTFIDEGIVCLKSTDL